MVILISDSRISGDLPGSRDGPFDISLIIYGEYSGISRATQKSPLILKHKN